MGSLVIIMSAVVGIFFFYQRKEKDYDFSVQRLHLFGLLVHALMIGCTVFLPRNLILSTIKTIALPVMIIYPLATVVLGKILSLILSRGQLLEELKISHTIFDNFMKNSPIYVFFKDENIRAIRLSDNYEVLLGKPIHQLLDKNMDELFPSDLAKQMIQDDMTVLKKEKTFQIEESFNGRYYNTIKFPIIINGQSKYLAGYTIDITDKKQTDQELKDLNEQLEERVCQRTDELEKSNQALQSFSYSVSHDLRAPLRAIEGFSKILLDDYGDKFDSTGSHYLKVISDSVGRMNQLINGLLLISRVSHADFKMGEIDMIEMVDKILKELKESNQLPKQVDWRIEPLLEGFGDPTLIRQVWINLIENAIKFSSTKEHPLITISSHLENDSTVFKVMDNGVGYNQKYAKQLFSVFQRLHSPEEFPGIGIGLALIERIIHRHGGKVWAEGVEGEGATFYFSLPIP